MFETGGFALAPQTIICRINIVGAVEPEGTAKHPSPKTSQEKGDAGSTKQSYTRAASRFDDPNQSSLFRCPKRSVRLAQALVAWLCLDAG